MSKPHSFSYRTSIHALMAVLLILSAAAVGQEGSDSTKGTKDPFEVPEGDVDQLLRFLDKIKNYEPATIEEYLEFRDKAPLLLKEASSKIRKLEKDKSSAAYKLATNTYLEMKVLGIVQEQPKDQQATLDELVRHISSKRNLEVIDLQLAYTLCQNLEMAGIQELAGQAYSRFGPRIAKSDNEEFAAVGEQMVASARRFNLTGKEMHVHGRTLGGDKFDLASWKGKVVLVDFWATWCPPCVAEIPNIKKLYNEYHDRGFEVVGVSLDDNRFLLEDFVQEQKIPWTILFAVDGQPSANHYGIGPIPAMFLVGRDGKVVSIDAIGPNLDQLLKEQFELGRAVGN